MLSNLIFSEQHFNLKIGRYLTGNENSNAFNDSLFFSEGSHFIYNSFLPMKILHKLKYQQFVKKVNSSWTITARKFGTVRFILPHERSCFLNQFFWQSYVDCRKYQGLSVDREIMSRLKRLSRFSARLDGLRLTACFSVRLAA